MDVEPQDKLTKLKHLTSVKRGFFDTDERSLLLATGVALWISTTVMIIVASYIPEFAPENAKAWRIGLGLPALVFLTGIIVIGPRVPDEYFYPSVMISYIPGILINLLLLTLTPATIAILANLTVPLIYGAFHLKTRDVLWSLVLASLIALSAPKVAPADATQNIASWLMIYIPLLWAMTLALHSNRQQYRQTRHEAEQQARTDSLTGLADLRGLQEFAASAVGAEPTDGGVIGLLMIDLDNFKAANSHYGHLGGDHALATIAQHMRKVAPKRSILARIGGDEFALLLAAGSRDRVEEVGEVMRAAVRAADIDVALPGVKIDASVGAAVFPTDGQTLDELIDVADRELYRAKDEHHAAALESPEDVTVPLDETAAAWVKEPETPHTSPHGAIQVWARSRTRYAQMAAGLWALGSVAMALALLMPDAVVPHPTGAWILIAAGLVMTAANMVVNEEPSDLIHVIGDIGVISGIGVLIALTGGFDSPALLLINLVVISQAWFWGTGMIALRLLGNVGVIASPLLYTSFTDFPWIAAAGAYAIAVVVVTLTLVLFLNGRVIEAVGRRAARRAATDALTGIANRRAFNEHVERMLEPDERGEIAPFSIVMIDLDNFKSVNTNAGHQAGDEVLREIAGLLASVERNDDLLARVGGDEFAAVLNGVGDDVAASLAQRFVDAVKGSPVAVRHQVGASAGFASFPRHGTTLDELMRVADDALMEVKETGKGAARSGRQSART